MASLSLALIVVCAVALAVESTRWLGVLALALLVVLHPYVSLALLLIAAGVYLYFNHWRDR
jgi:hypothetical protein